MADHYLSESVYVGMCHKIGTPQQVASRRERCDNGELMANQLMKNQLKIRVMVSGSLKEGLRLPGSDIDIMFLPSDFRVLWNFSQFEFRTFGTQIPVISDCSESPPGFTLLRLPIEILPLIKIPSETYIDDAIQYVMEACVWHNGKVLLSSSKYREVRKKISFPGSSTHGPCNTGTLGSGLEYDEVYCFISKFWPPSAFSWIDRCQVWPQPHVVNDIVRSGCHFVAIGHKLGKQVDNEWRISFTQAEYKLVYSMNHSQFLTYGMLKLFLKEIINNGVRDEDKLLCSYHMKTAVFWAIQQNTLPYWCPENLLVGFWVCFKLLLKWVYEGVCPNFFIPQNNMFLNNIFGEAQKRLFMRLYGLYEKGVALLLCSSSMRTSIINVLCNPRRMVRIDEQNLIPEVELDIELFNDMVEIDVIHPSSLRQCLKVLRIAEPLINYTHTQSEIVLLQKVSSTIFQGAAFYLNNMYIDKGLNKFTYIADKLACHLLKCAVMCGFSSGMLYVAMHFYRTCRYRKALSVLEMAKAKLVQPWLIYKRNVDQERYNYALGGQALPIKMRKALAWDIKLNHKICYIEELVPEQQPGRENHTPLLYIPPCVLLHMLEFLCYRHVDTMRAQTALHELQVLVHHDQGHFVPEQLRDISWEILGICQHIRGDLRAAMFSYEQSLIQKPFNRIQSSTRKRIQDIHTYLYGFLLTVYEAFSGFNNYEAPPVDY
nr:uncharacterized protein LOC117688740 [Crassostrea gigas]